MRHAVAGAIHSASVAASGSLSTWGSNASGQVGNGTKVDRSTPVSVFSSAAWRSVSAGRDHSLAVRPDGVVWAWGDNSHGQLGDGTTVGRAAPVALSGVSNVVQVAAGDAHSLALRSDGTVWAWGVNAFGAVGSGAGTGIQAGPIKVNGIAGVIAVSAGQDWSLALKADGTVWAWGRNHRGQLGTTAVSSSTTPLQVPTPVGITAIAAGDAHGLALRFSGTVWAWGDDTSGQLGDGTPGGFRTTPQQPSSIQGSVFTPATAIAAGGTFSMVLGDVRVFTWGSNANGQLGDGTTTDRAWPEIVEGAAALGEWPVAIAAGGGHAIVIQTDGTARAWGLNSSGQLGDGTTTTRRTPVAVSGSVSMTSPAAGGRHTLSLVPTGNVRVWGENESGQLGNNSTLDRKTPTTALLF
jgi:alpha-tubulin suppressor-like RCC1 family protein